MRFTSPFYAFLVLALGACNGSIGDAGAGSDEAGPGPWGELERGVIEGGGFVRLSVRELERTLDSLFPSIASERARFAEESFGHFDTEREEARIGTAFMDSAISVGESIASLAMDDAALRAELLDCDEADTPACLSSFVERWPLRLIQRELEGEERNAFVELAHADLGTSEDVVETALTALLVHPEFLFRVTVGEGDEDTRTLTQREVLARLSFFLWGQAPDASLRERAAGSDLRDATIRGSLAEWMMDDPRAAAQRSAFHAQWFGYAELSHEGLGNDMWRESDALVELATAEGADYRELLLSAETYLSEELAGHYGMPSPETGEGWVRYGASPRSGLLAHASFLSSYRSQGEGSPTKRGKAVLNRLLCRNIELPDDMDVNVDDAPAPDQCRKEFLQTVHSTGGCASCHEVLDGIGYGLEIFDGNGAQIENERDKPECRLDGEGSFAGNEFAGASGLAEVIVAAPDYDRCVVQQLMRFQVGTAPEQSEVGFANVQALTEQYVQSGHSYRALVLALIGSEEFAKVSLP